MDLKWTYIHAAHAWSLGGLTVWKLRTRFTEDCALPLKGTNHPGCSRFAHNSCWIDEKNEGCSHLWCHQLLQVMGWKVFFNLETAARLQWVSIDLIMSWSRRCHSPTVHNINVVVPLWVPTETRLALIYSRTVLLLLIMSVTKLQRDNWNKCCLSEEWYSCTSIWNVTIVMNDIFS